MYKRNYQVGISGWLNVALPLLGLTLIGLLACSIWWWESSGREQLLYKEVVVLKEDVSRGTVIDAGMTMAMKIEETQMLDGALASSASIVGLEAKQYIPAHAQLVQLYFEAGALMTGADRYDVQIPNEWIYAVPDTLRRKDEIVFCEVTADVLDQNKTGGRISLEADEEADGQSIGKQAAEQQASGSGKDNDSGKSNDSGKGNDPGALSVYAKSQASTVLPMAGKPLLRTVVSYVKDSANREVVTVSKEERYDGSAAISHIQVMVTLPEFTLLEEAIKRGSKLIVMYTEGGNL